MKALAYRNAHKLENFSLEITEVPRPVLKATDVLVRVRASSVNPVDFKIRQSRSGSAEAPVILGWDAAGVIEELGSEVKGFQLGDEVYYAGDLTRAGSYAELQAVDHRIIAKKPKSLSFAEAAAIPLTALTAWEALLESRIVSNEEATTVLIVGGSGGVGSISIQLLKALTPAKVIATASREETKAWVKSLGADLVLDHSKDLVQEFQVHGIKGADVLFLTTHTLNYLKSIPSLMNPFGHVVAIDDPEQMDVRSLKGKSLRFHWELMFSKTLHNYKLESQGEILKRVAELIDTGKIKTTIQKPLKGLTTKNLQEAHALLESGKSIGKIVVEY